MTRLRRRRTIAVPRAPPSGRSGQAGEYLAQLRTAARTHETAWLEFRERLEGKRAADERARRQLRDALHRFHQASVALTALPPPSVAGPAATLPAVQRLWTLLCQLGVEAAAYARSYMEVFGGENVDVATLAVADQRIRRAGELYTESQRALRHLRLAFHAGPPAPATPLKAS